MILRTIDTAEPNFPVDLFTPEEDTAEIGESDWLAITCCSYITWYQGLDSIWETDVDE